MSIEKVCKDEPSSLWEYKPHTTETVWRQLGSSQLLLSLIQGLYMYIDVETWALYLKTVFTKSWSLRRQTTRLKSSETNSSYLKKIHHLTQEVLFKVLGHFSKKNSTANYIYKFCLAVSI